MVIISQKVFGGKCRRCSARDFIADSEDVADHNGKLTGMDAEAINFDRIRGG